MQTQPAAHLSSLRYQLFNNGLYSELNNMMLALLYCSITQRPFKLSSSYSTNFEKLGWQDYFEPFCEEFHSVLLHRFDMRSVQSPSLLKRSIKKIVRFILRSCLKPILCPGDLCTVDAWDDIRALRDQDNFSTKDVASYTSDNEEAIGGFSLQGALHLIHNRIWVFNPHMKHYIDQSLVKLQLPDRYVGIHIRRGDKDIEAELEHEIAYMELLARKSDCKDVYVMTDDSEVLPSLQQHFPEYRFYSMSPTMSGYINADFHALSAADRGRLIRSLLCENEILRRSEVFVGTFSSNIGVYQGIARKDHSYGVDAEEWLFW